VTYTTVVSGTTITASWGNQTRDQLVQPFASSSARSSAVSSPPDGMLSFLADVRRLDAYNLATTAWEVAGPESQWTDYSGQSGLFTASTTNPVVGTGGNAFLGARWRYTAHKRIRVEFAMTFGTGGGAAAGSGTYRVATPSGHNMATTGGTAAKYNDSLGMAWMSTGSVQKVGHVRSISATQVEVISMDSTGFVGFSGAGSWPQTGWSNGYSLTLAFEYDEA
jgi:hypothetical protein